MRSTRLSRGERSPMEHAGRRHQTGEMVRDRSRKGLIPVHSDNHRGGSVMAVYDHGAFTAAPEEKICL